MAWVTLSKGIYYPGLGQFGMSAAGGTVWPGFTNAGTMDAAGEMVAYIGNIFIDNRPASGQTLSSAGGKIHFLAAGTITFANAGTTMRVGIQDISASGPIFRPDEDWTGEPYDDLVGGTDTISANVYNTATISTGSRSITHGDAIAIVFDMSARAGADSVILRGITRTTNNVGWPGINTKAGGTWGTVGVSAHPSAVIEFDDGTLGWFDDFYPVQTSTVENFIDSTNPDERGITFRVPCHCKVDAIAVSLVSSAAASDYTLRLYSDALGTPVQIASIARTGEQAGNSNTSVVPIHIFRLSSEVEMSPGVTYALAVKADSTSNVGLPVQTLSNAGFRGALESHTTGAYATRNWSTGSDPGTAFSETTTKWIEGFSVRISAVDSGNAPGILRPNSGLLRPLH